MPQDTSTAVFDFHCSPKIDSIGHQNVSHSIMRMINNGIFTAALCVQSLKPSIPRGILSDKSTIDKSLECNNSKPSMECGDIFLVTNTPQVHLNIAG
jgi:hypothetical protein